MHGRLQNVASEYTENLKSIAPIYPSTESLVNFKSFSMTVLRYQMKEKIAILHLRKIFRRPFRNQSIFH